MVALFFVSYFTNCLNVLTSIFISELIIKYHLAMNVQILISCSYIPNKVFNTIIAVYNNYFPLNHL